ncbi:MAG: type II toxin-antitoxin system RelE/ParE family toxin [Thermomicrobiales bacterium]|nr:type II toxin-antitoxin system RelE/ParE family toxin [Thermomicrobiales bacterium]
MSNRELRFSSDAVNDLEELLSYTLDTWGEGQQVAYSEKLNAGMELLARFPGRGTRRDEVSPGLFSLPIEQHIVYFRFDDSVLRIIRILHKAQHPERVDWTGVISP